MIYSDMRIGKEITLNYNGMGPVALYVTKVTAASSIAAANLEIPTGYLTSQFTRFFTYDAVSQTLTEVSPSSCNSVPTDYMPSSGYGGVIIANAGLTRAMAVYGRSTAVSNGYVDRFQLFNFLNCGGTSKWGAVWEQHTIPAGASTYRAFVMSGTLWQGPRFLYTPALGQDAPLYVSIR